MKHFKLLMALAMLAMCAGSAFADVITYTESTTGSGTLGTSSFNDALITLSFTGNTSNVTCGGELCSNDAGPDTVRLTIGLGTATFLDDIAVFDNQGSGYAVFLNLSGDFIFATINAAFYTYDLMTEIGPVTGSSSVSSDPGAQTTDGLFVIDSAGDATFTATTGAPAIPEPSSLVLFGTRLLGFAGVARRKLAR